jgi:hypothetical protein
MNLLDREVNPGAFAPSLGIGDDPAGSQIGTECDVWPVNDDQTQFGQPAGLPPDGGNVQPHVPG